MAPLLRPHAKRSGDRRAASSPEPTDGAGTAQGTSEVVDCQNAYEEMVSLESFVSGFRLAAGISMELAGEWYFFEKEEEKRAGKA